MDNIKDLLKDHLRIEIGHPRKGYEEYENEIVLQVYWDDELITEANSMYQTLWI